VDVEQVKERHRLIWGFGDYSALSRLLEPASAALCEAIGVSTGEPVLDVAAGDGNFAIAAAKAGADVVASDLSPTMVDRGRRRSDGEGLEIEWVVADAEELPFEDDRFARVGSVFGAMIAPRPRIVAGELLRVARPGGSVGMTAWTPGSFAAELIRLGRKYAPPADGVPESEEWGVEETARERFEGLAASVECERRPLVMEGESAEAVGQELVDTTPTMVAAREFLPPEQFEALRADTMQLVERWNQADDGSLRIGAEYLLTLVRKPG
jgi:SAM-dependent methyltransferase